MSYHAQVGGLTCSVSVGVVVVVVSTDGTWKNTGKQYLSLITRMGGEIDQ